MFDMKVGEFLEEDPSGFYGDQVNTRDYCGNSPTNGTDPSGLATDTIPGVMSLADFVANVLKPLEGKLDHSQIRIKTSPGGITLAGEQLDFPAVKSLGALLRGFHRRLDGTLPNSTGKILMLAMHGHITGLGNTIQIAGSGEDEDYGLVDDLGKLKETPQLTQQFIESQMENANALTPANAYWVGRAIKPYLAPKAIIVLNGCAAALVKSDANSIPAQLAKGSGATVVASMGFTTGDIGSGHATITATDQGSGLTFGELAGWYKLKDLLNRSTLTGLDNAAVAPSKADLDKKLRWLNEQKSSNPAASKVLSAYDDFQKSFYPSADGEVRIYNP